MKIIARYAVSVTALVAGTMLPIRSLTAQQSDPPPGTYQAREDHQQDRIANGVQGGQLTAGETKSLEHQEASLNAQAAADRASDGGHLTAAERGQLNGEQNHLSNEIHTDKHNGATAHYGNSEVGQRQRDQQDRIAQGIRSGSLSPSEASHLEGKEQHINHEVASDRHANGGHLTSGEKSSINHQQNHVSHDIHRDKHNGKRNP
jgi:hypothetical protein